MSIITLKSEYILNIQKVSINIEINSVHNCTDFRLSFLTHRLHLDFHQVAGTNCRNWTCFLHGKQPAYRYRFTNTHCLPPSNSSTYHNFISIHYYPLTIFISIHYNLGSILPTVHTSPIITAPLPLIAHFLMILSNL